MKKNKEHIKVCRCFDSDKFKIWQIREAVDIAVGDDGNKSKEVIEILKTEKWDKYATIV
jgi:hypothetical protein|tara:strand:+ start:141 stop:317 length:177 start_codon:yes stop_codon:yes gene_type:complete